MPEEKRMLGNHSVEQSIHIGDREVFPFTVCYCDYNNPLSAPWPSDVVASDDCLEAMSIFTDRVREQIERMKSELSRFRPNMMLFTKIIAFPMTSF